MGGADLPASFGVTIGFAAEEAVSFPLVTPPFECVLSLDFSEQQQLFFFNPDASLLDTTNSSTRNTRRLTKVHFIKDQIPLARSLVRIKGQNDLLE